MQQLRDRNDLVVYVDRHGQHWDVRVSNVVYNQNAQRLEYRLRTLDGRPFRHADEWFTGEELLDPRPVQQRQTAPPQYGPQPGREPDPDPDPGTDKSRHRGFQRAKELLKKIPVPKVFRHRSR